MSNKYMYVFEEYYEKYAEIWTEADLEGDALAQATYKVVREGAGWMEMAYVYKVDEQQLYDNVKCQRMHDRWLDHLDEARYIGA